MGDRFCVPGMKYPKGIKVDGCDMPLYAICMQCMYGAAIIGPPSLHRFSYTCWSYQKYFARVYHDVAMSLAAGLGLYREAIVADETKESFT
jgi:hypothetical protein